MPRPTDTALVRCTAWWTAETAPRALFDTHRLRVDTWGELTAESGEVVIAFADGTRRSTRDGPIPIPPADPHHIAEASADARFRVCFYR